MIIYFYSGPGLAIRIICGDEPYQGSEFAETNIILGQIVDFVTAIKKVSRVCERMVLIMLKSNKSNYSPVWLRLARFVPVGMLEVNFCLLESTALYALTTTPTPSRCCTDIIMSFENHANFDKCTNILFIVVLFFF